ncbi:MAG: GNAT family N-acetyltransferase [Planctomycetes bacterium]|nr:GNAT family N-acetyltransferase [Planctomycetota bacterium]
MSLSLLPLTAARLQAFRALLGGPDFGGCFCAVWTAHGPDWAARCGDPAQPNYAEAARRVAAGEHLGYLVEDDGQLVAWCGAGPKPGFPLLASKLASRLSPMDPAVWSVGCLALSSAWRGAGRSARVLEAVIERARASGAEALEAYPTLPWDEPRSYRGAHSTYARLGFAIVGREAEGEGEVLLMRLELGSGPGAAP